MRFSLTCPKCQSSRVELMRDPRFNTGPKDVYLHCAMCGKTIYGAGVHMELERQHRLFEEKKKQRIQEEEIRAAAEAARKKAEAKRARLEAAQRKQRVESLQCAWATCDKGHNGESAMRRSNSIYCSRDCSNRNARARHKARKAG